MGARLKAYVLSNRADPEGHVRVAFAPTANRARSSGLEGATYLQTAARRAPAFDRYAPGPVPLAALLAAGWHFECGNCCRGLCRDDDAVVVDREGGAEVFCGEACRARAEGRWRGIRFVHAELNGAYEAAVARFPGVRFQLPRWSRRLDPRGGFRLVSACWEPASGGRSGRYADGESTIEWDEAEPGRGNSTGWRIPA
jgi:hypothetical protein